MTAAAAASVAQFNQGETLANTSGTGVDQSSPNTDNTIGGTHSQCNSLLVGFAWLEPSSPSQSVTVRIRPSYARRFKEATSPVGAGKLWPCAFLAHAPRPTFGPSKKKKPGAFANAGLRSTRSILRSGRGCLTSPR